MSLGRRSLSCPEEKLKPFFRGEQSCFSKEETIFHSRAWLLLEATEILLLWEHGCSLVNNLNLFYFEDLFSSISFMNEKNNLRKVLSLKPLGCKGDSDHYISFFTFENNIYDFILTINRCVGTIKKI